MPESASPRWGMSAADESAAVDASVRHAFHGRTPSAGERERYVQTLHLDDLRLATACAAGNADAWEHFMREYPPVLRRAADALDPSGGARDLAEALSGDLYGLTDRGGERQSLFRYFHGRSSLATWLRAVLAQRHVDRIRASRRLAPLPDDDVAATPAHIRAVRDEAVDPDRHRRARMVREALASAIAALEPRDRLRLACYYAQDMTLAAIGRMLHEHEATVSRQLSRARHTIRAAVEERLRAHHRMSDDGIAECLRAVADDPGPLDVADLLGSESETRALAGAGKKRRQDRST